MRRLVAVLCVLVVACAGESVTTTTVLEPAQPAAPSTMVPTTIAPSASAPPSTVPPTTVVESEVPADLLALIGAPMPEVDLTIEGPEDVERWLQEFLRWEEWTMANPAEGLDSLEQFASGFYLRAQSEALPRLTQAGLVSVGGGLLVREAQADFSDVEIGVISVVFETTQKAPILTLSEDSLEVIHRQAPAGNWVSADAILVRDEAGRWLLSEFFSR